jgi:hypothetical protein
VQFFRYFTVNFRLGSYSFKLIAAFHARPVIDNNLLLAKWLRKLRSDQQTSALVAGRMVWTPEGRYCHHGDLLGSIVYCRIVSLILFGAADPDFQCAWRGRIISMLQCNKRLLPVSAHIIVWDWAADEG